MNKKKKTIVKKTWIVTSLKDGRHARSTKGKPKRVDHPLVAGSSIGQKPRPHRYFQQDLDRTKNSEVVHVILGSSDHTDVCSSLM